LILILDAVNLTDASAQALLKALASHKEGISMKAAQLTALVIIGGSMIFGLSSAFAQQGDPKAVRVSVGYADSNHPPAFVPSPWQGEVSVFIGNGPACPPCDPGWDAGAILLVNPSGQSLTVDDVAVSFGSATIDLWGSFTIPAKGRAILTQTNQFTFNFDTSELTTGTCSTPPSFKPVVHVTVGAKNPVMKDFIDENLVLLAGGLNPSHCVLPAGANEGLPFEEIH
jgi:hypothetical protein